MLSRFSHVQLCVTPWTAAHQAPLSLGFSRQEYWSGLPFPSPMHACMLSRFSHVRLCVTPWTAAHQAPLSMGFSRQKYWSGLPFPSPEVAISRCKLVYTGWINNKVLSYSTGNYIQYPVINHNGKEYENNTSLLITILIIILSLAVASVMSNSLWPHGP